MTDAQKLEALIEHAIKNGYRKSDKTYLHKVPGWPVTTIRTTTGTDYVDYPVEAQHLILDHDFVCALFGEDTVHSVTRLETYKRYEVAMMQAVISDNPIDYMYKAVFDE